MISARAAKRYADAHLRASGSPFVAIQAAKDNVHDVRVVSYGDPDRPGELLVGGALVVTDGGVVHDIDSTPDAVDVLMASLDQPPATVQDGSRPPWPELGDEVEKPYFAQLLREIDAERQAATVYPAPGDVFAAFELTAYDDVKVVILGQDPYHQPGEANGLCFSVARNRYKLPRSLQNIHQALANAGFGPQHHGDLTEWAKQGVLLLNTALTVRRSEANSHAERWREFTDAVVARLDERPEPIVFVLWGEHAQRRSPLITSPHVVVTAPHPASRREAQQEFRRGRTFIEVNEHLGSGAIDWALR